MIRPFVYLQFSLSSSRKNQEYLHIQKLRLYYTCLKCGPFAFGRAWRVKTEVPPLLVQICQYLFDLGLLPSVAENQRDCQHGGHGPICGSDHHNLHRAQYPFHGHGALSNDWRVWQCPLSWKPGKYLLTLLWTQMTWFRKCSTYSHLLSLGFHGHLHSWNVPQDHRPGPLLLFPGGLEHLWRHYR